MFYSQYNEKIAFRMILRKHCSVYCENTFSKITKEKRREKALGREQIETKGTII